MAPPAKLASSGVGVKMIGENGQPRLTLLNPETVEEGAPLMPSSTPASSSASAHKPYMQVGARREGEWLPALPKPRAPACMYGKV